MAIFNRTRKAAISPAPITKAAAGGLYSSQNTGPNMIGQYYSYQEGVLRNRAMQIPAISRSRDLHATVLAAMPLKMERRYWDDTARDMEDEELAPRAWLRQPDPSIPYATLIAWTLDDLFFFGRAFWYITSRTADGYPASFTRLPAGSITTEDQAGPVWFAPSNQVYFQGGEIDPANLVQFISPVQGIIYASEQAIATGLKLEDARLRNAASAIPAGVLRQTGGEPLSATELADMAAAFNAARASNQTAALNEYVEYIPTTATPDKMMLIESSHYQNLAFSQLCNIPPYLLGANVGSYSYQNSPQARLDLWMFGTHIYAQCIEQTLSMNTIVPNGTFICFDTDDFLVDTETEVAPATPNEDSMPDENTQETLAN
jgi:phage portal protein BeeE